MAGEEKRDGRTERRTDRPTKPFLGRPLGSGKNSRSTSTFCEYADCREIVEHVFVEETSRSRIEPGQLYIWGLGGYVSVNVFLCLDRIRIPDLIDLTFCNELSVSSFKG